MKRTQLFSALFALSLPAFAVDGVIEINHARALAGGVTPGDTPGYPVTLSQSGSYRLTGNLILPDENTTGISSAAGRVSLDLNGFAITGPNSCSYSGGITCTAIGTGVGVLLYGDHNAVRNGIISGTGSDAVVVGSFAMVENLGISHVGVHGVNATGESVVIRNNSINYVKSAGINTSDSALISNNAMNYIGGYGIYNYSGSRLLVTGNTITAHNSALFCGGSMAYSNNVLDSFSTTAVHTNCSGDSMGSNREL